MNTKILMLALVAGLAACQKTGIVSQKTTYELVGEAKSVPGNYGDVVKEAGVVSPAILLQKVESSGTFTGKVSGQIKEVCTNKGCWFAMELPNGASMRVTFKDYGFFIPTNSQGFPITIEGIATLTETDVKTLQHYAEDQGKSKEEVEAITSPKKEITFALCLISRSWHNLANFRESSAATYSAFVIAAIRWAEASRTSPIGRQARINIW